MRRPLKRLKKALINAVARLGGPRVVRVVVLGHQKSGTSVIAALISKMVNRPYANDPLFESDSGRGEFADTLVNGRDDLLDLVNARRTLFCRYVLKDPDLTFVADKLPKVFSNAKFLFVIRDPRDTIRSIADRLELTPDELAQPYQPADRINRHWGLVLSGRLPDHGERALPVAAVLAHRWVESIESCLRFPRTISITRYEDFRNAKIQTIRQIVAELGLRERADISPWVDVQFQPKGNASANWDTRLGKEVVDNIEEICATHMARFGYSPTWRGEREASSLG